MAWDIVVAGGVLFLVSLLWYLWAGRALMGQRGVTLGQATAARRVVRKEPVVWGRKHAVDAATEPTKHLIDRELRVAYSHKAYVNRAFYVNVRVGPQDGKLPPLTPEELKKFKQTRSERLQFEALEEEPLVKIELKFSEEEFRANKTVEQQRLKKDGETRFRFLLKPLKAEHCVLTVVISYVSSEPVPEQVVERVVIDKTISPAQGPETKEHIEQVTVAPATSATQEIEVKTVELPVAVKSLFGLNATELGFLQKALGAAVVLVLLGIAFLTGRVESTDAIWYAVVGVANAAGVPLIDVVAKPFGKPDADVPEGEGEGES
jgi:hypothetical protein